ncbi:hypothetical protein [Halostagnicola kamekurae]|uniref:hypothetical protein n=1 Tax=Halostagnicola kamekurae TaxID=619731 RepID=UPI001113B0D7|nr:hypothetical protein [Halostagnicola kamekurae]
MPATRDLREAEMETVTERIVDVLDAPSSGVVAEGVSSCVDDPARSFQSTVRPFRRFGSDGY